MRRTGFTAAIAAIGVSACANAPSDGPAAASAAQPAPAAATPPPASAPVPTAVQASAPAPAPQARTQAAGDALKVLMCGTGGPLPIADRAKPCVAIEAGGALYLVDIGPEATERLLQRAAPMARAKAVFLTHFHSDHIGELGEFNMQSWVAGRPDPLLVVGPPGVEKVAQGFNLAYELDHVYRNAHHETETQKFSLSAAKLAPRAVTVSARGGAETGLAFEDGDLKVTAIAVEHAPVTPAYAYRFDYKGRSVVISGDTRKHPPLAIAAKGADVLIHEAQSNEMMMMASRALGGLGNARGAGILADTTTYHTPPLEAAELAKEAGVDLLVLSHITQAGMPVYSEAAFTKGLPEAGLKDWRMAKDGMTIDLPVGSDEILIGGG